MKKQIIFSSLVLIGLLTYLPNLTSAETVPTPIAYWNFNNGAEVNAGLVSDSIGQYNSENKNASWISSGYDGGGMRFDCNADNTFCGSVKTPVISTNNDFTLLFRMKVGDISTARFSRVIFTAHESHAYIYGGLAGQANEVNKITTAQMGNFAVSNDNSWHHYAFIWGRDGKHYFYKDGLLASYATGAGINVPSSEFEFGRGGDLSSPIIELDEIKVYNQALTAMQIGEENGNNKLLCKSDTWSCGDWGTCSSNGQQTKMCTKTYDCEYADTPSPPATQACTYIAPTCTSWTYSDWGTCSTSGQQIRTISSSSPQGCTAGSPILTQSCTYTPPVSQDAQGSFELKIPAGKDNGVLNSDKIKIDYYGSDIITKLYLNSVEISLGVDQFNIISYGPPLINHQIVSFYPPTNSTSGNLIIHTASDKTKDVGYLKIRQVQEIVPPTCTADIWECDTWNTCSPSGIQSRSCRRTFDCPSAQTAAPAADQFCEAPYRPQQTAPSQSEEIANQSTIIKSTVKLLCPVDEKSASQGSGTVIDSKGTILTNKHVVAGTLGCLVGFINDFDDEPYFGERQIADIIKVSSSQDIAILKIRNPKNKSLSYVDTTRGASNFSLGTKITTYGYPAKFGTKITYTSGDFSGTDSDYLKTTAILEYGNSGGGAYLKNGTFIGVPSAVVKGELNALGYILSINTINAWLNNSSIASNSSNNQFSRVSVLENIDLKKLDTLNLFIPNGDEGGFPDVSKNHQNSTAIKFLKERKIVNGYPDGTFKPENTVNRAELLTILVNAKIGKPNANEYKNCFPDVKTEWFAPYVCYAKNAGWVKGYPDGKYRPGQTVNKVEALTILLNSQSISTSSSLTSKPFNDVNTTDWFAKYVSKAKEMGILEETGNTLNPGEGMKRAGISEILYRLLIQ